MKKKPLQFLHLEYHNMKKDMPTSPLSGHGM